MFQFLRNTELIFILAFVFALFIPEYSFNLKPLITPLLAIGMVLSLRDIDFNLRQLFSDKLIFVPFLLNYGIASAIPLLLAMLFITDTEVFAGFVILASVPSAAAIITYSNLFNSSTKNVVNGQIFIYLGSLVVAPLLVYFSLGTYLDISRLLQTLVILILVPLIISRPCRRINNFVFDNSLVFINLIFFLVIYVAVGSNIEILIFDLTFYLVFSIIFVRNFVFGTLVYLISKRLNFSKVDAVNNTLFSVYKNGGLSVVFAIELAGGYSILAPVMSVLLSAPLFLYLSFLFKRFN